MIGRRRALRAGRTLNDAAMIMERMESNRVVPEGTALTLFEAVRVANEIMFQYYLIPRELRNKYERRFERRPKDGVSLHPVAEE